MRLFIPSFLTPEPSAGRIVITNTSAIITSAPGERWYGNTQEGEYMSQGAANAAGYRETENGQ